jgi:glycerol-3-phosphate acyltransferase PlsX
MGKVHIKIGIDLTGGDHPPEILFQELLQIDEGLDPASHLVFFAPASLITSFETHLKSSSIKNSVSFVETKDPILMDENPLSSVRLKKDSPSLVGLKALKEKQIDALISTGNSGALVSGARLILKTLRGIRTPGLLALLPTLLKPLVVIDVGANINCTAHHLFQFAQMGIAYQKSHGNESPKVGLLNIGSEKEKGRIELREAYKKLTQLNNNDQKQIRFIGNIEGKKAFLGEVDVLVTDGFSGNIFLKTVEGVTSFIVSKLIENELNHIHTKTSTNLLQLLNQSEYPGALICGVDGIVIKCHGDSTAKAIHSGIKGAITLVKGRFLEKLKKLLKP